MSFLPYGKRVCFYQKSLQEKGDFALEEERRLAYVESQGQEKGFSIFCNEKSLSRRLMDAVPSRFINELPENNIEKNEIVEKENDEDFDFNQDNSIELG